MKVTVKTRLLAPLPIIEKVTDIDHFESETDHVEANATEIEVSGRRFNLHDGTHGFASAYGHNPTSDAWECIDSHIEGVTGGDGGLSITFRDEALATGYDRLRVVVSNDDGSDTREVPILR